MKNSIYQELEAHVRDLINDGVLTPDNFDEWHFHAFNEDYYIIGYYEAEQWLKRHDVTAFEAIAVCIEYERDNFGEVTKTYEDAETTVNMYVYVLGEELLSEIADDLLEELEGDGDGDGDLPDGIELQDPKNAPA